MSNAKNKHRNIRKGGHVKTVRYHDLLRAKRTQNPLSGLNPAKVRRLYELYREGKYADVQLAWDALEEYDDMLGTVLERRQSALGEMEWDVLIDARAVGASSLAGGSLSTPTQGGKSDLQMLAEAQQDFITRRLRAVENLSDAIKWLGLADFRRYSALEVLPAGSGERWLPIHHWLLCRPALEGAWCYNEAAETSCTRVEPIDMSAVILREVARPIDLVAMFLISAKEAAIDGWDSFLEVFGNPALFFKMPPGTSDDQRDEYASIIKEISSDGAGVYPDGGEIHTVETSAANADAFSSRAEWCDKALVRRATGGLLTVLAESGSGTLAGSAHMEAFRQIAANDAISIAECINRQYVRRRIAAEFPGEPVLVYFTLTQPVINDRAATVNMLCQLAGQRWRATDEAVSEEVGVEVHTEEVQSTNYEVRSENSAPAVQVPVMNAGAMPDKPNREEEPPLTEEELAAFRGLSEPNRERMEQHRAEVEQALRAAADLDGESGTEVPSSDENVVANARPMDILTFMEKVRNGDIIANSGGDCRADNPMECWKHGVKLTNALLESGYTHEELDKIDEIPNWGLLPAGECKKDAMDSLKKIANTPLVNKNFTEPIEVSVTGGSAGKIVSGNAVGQTFVGLVDSGVCDKDTAYRAHMTAAANIDTLFQNAPRMELQDLYHMQDTRDEAIHFYSPFTVEGVEKPLTADISIMKFKGRNNRTAYSLGLRVQPPLPSSGGHQES